VLEAGLSRLDVGQLKTFFCHQIFEIVALLKARLRVATTACSYFQRFYHLHSFLEHDPRHVAPACVYLAGALRSGSMP
jgi:cyclin C